MVSSKVRLWIEYALIAALVCVGGLAITLKFQAMTQEQDLIRLGGQVEKTQLRLSVVEEVNRAQETVISELATQREIDGASIISLMDTYQRLVLADRSLRNQLSELEKNDEARTFLDALVPDSVGCLYDDSCTAAGEAPGNSTLSPRGNTSSLLPASKKEAPDKSG